MLAELRDGEEAGSKMLNKLTDYEMKELIQRAGGLGQMEYLDEVDKADRVGGLGFVKKQKGDINEVFAKALGANDKPNLNSIEGANLDELKYLD